MMVIKPLCTKFEGEENKNQLIEKRFAVCVISGQKSSLHAPLTTVAVDRPPDRIHC